MGWGQIFLGRPEGDPWRSCWAEMNQSKTYFFVLWPHIHLIFILCILILCVRKKLFYRTEKGYVASELQFVKQSRETRTNPLTRLNLILMVLLYHAYSTPYSLLNILVYVLKIKLKPPFRLRQQIIIYMKNLKINHPM